MSDKIRGALFNALGELDGLTVLDAFAGSGALSFEAVSRGAQSVIAIENDHQAQKTIEANIKALSLISDIKLIKTSAGAWLDTSDETFDVILCDPPYDDLQPNLLIRLAERANPDGLIVYSLPPGTGVPLSITNYKLVTSKDYGDSQLVFYRRIA